MDELILEPNAEDLVIEEGLEQEVLVKEYRKIKVSEYKTIDPKSLHQTQLKTIKISLDVKAYDRLKIEFDPYSPYTQKAVDLLSMNMDDLKVKKKSFFYVDGESDKECQTRYNIYQLQQSEIIRLVISEEIKMKRLEKEESIKSQQQIEQNRYLLKSYEESSISVNGLSQLPIYKSPSDMIEGWIEDKTEQAMKYKNKTEKLKKDRIMEVAMEYDKYKEQKKENELMSEKQEIRKSRYNNDRAQAAHSFNEQMEEMKIKKKKDERLNLINLLKQRNEQIEKDEKGFEMFKQKQLESNETKFRIIREKMQNNHSNVTKKRKMIQNNDGRISPDKMIKKQEDTESRRQVQLEQRSSKITNKGVNLVKAQSLKDFNTQQVEQDQLLGYFNKKKKTEIHELNIQSKVDQLIQDKLERSKYQEEILNARRKKIQQHLEDAAEYINTQLTKNNQQVLERCDKKDALQEERIKKKKLVTERNLKNFDKVRLEYQEKLNRMLQKQNAINKSNLSVFSKRAHAIQKILMERAQSQKDVESYSMMVDDEISKNRRQPKLQSATLSYQAK